jgi:hypothetical protein
LERFRYAEGHSVARRAHSNGDRLLGADILEKWMSLQCYDFDQPCEALELARTRVTPSSAA